ncbi:hypothetical protein AAG570_009156 [Ranatra chinensis]|uniref:Uncharacterized protein n=1 Tax=Ranatra chinensis TaxID=642074 RepID=A0ABD0YT04_9HEMI
MRQGERVAPDKAGTIRIRTGRLYICLLVGLSGQADGQLLGGYLGGGWLRGPMAVLADSPLYVADTLAKVPLLLVPQADVTILRDAHITAFSPTRPVVTCQVSKYSMDATPAVRVELERPVVVNGAEAMVGFPAEVSVALGGLRVSVPVGALIAPVHQLAGTHVLRVLYAVPTSPLFLQYPFVSPFSYLFRPFPDMMDDKKVTGVAMPEKKPTMTGIGAQEEGRPVISVLEFPTELARPQSLFYQPPLDEGEDELGNRGPPEAVVPAGIVQSTQPHSYLTPFLNSKESPFLQSLRDQANADKNKDDPESTGVEAL